MTATPTKAHAASSLARTGLAPRGLSREQAAAYVGVSVAIFDAMVKDGRMPKPKAINSRNVWDLTKLDAAFDLLPDANGANNTATTGPDAGPNAGPNAGDVIDDKWGRARV